MLKAYLMWKMTGDELYFRGIMSPQGYQCQGLSLHSSEFCCVRGL